MDAGYTQVTFGPNPEVSQWFAESFFGEHTPGAVQNTDGTLSLGCSDGGSVYEVVTATQDLSKPNDWSGLAFGGGGYFEAVYAFANGTNGYAAKDTLAFWANDIENMSESANYNLFSNWIELDIMEFDDSSGSASAQATGYGHSFHNWYGVRGAGDKIDPHALLTPASAANTWSTDNTYGLLWVPATATHQGHVSFYNNNQLVGGPIYWNQYSPASIACPPSNPSGALPNFGDGGVNPFSGGAILDSRHLAPILTAGTCMTVKSVTVWQASAADNITQ